MVKIKLADETEFEVKRVMDTTTETEEQLYIECRNSVSKDDVLEHMSEFKHITVVKDDTNCATYENFSSVSVERTIAEDAEDNVRIVATKKL